jgi:hypothetical protein
MRRTCSRFGKSEAGLLAIPEEVRYRTPAESTAEALEVARGSAHDCGTNGESGVDMRGVDAHQR